MNTGILNASILCYIAKVDEVTKVLRDFQGEHVNNMEAILEALGWEERPYVTVSDVVKEIERLKALEGQA